MEDKKFYGSGSYTFGNGDKYQGEIVNGKPEGNGTMVFVNYDQYEGDWKNGLMEGCGEYMFYDKVKDKFSASYKGQFFKGIRNGVGRMKYKSRDVYEGQWQNDKRTGDGICWFGNGDCFHGLWQFDKMLRGVYRKSNGDFYDGELKESQFNGYGKYHWIDGRWYEGTFLDGKPLNGKIFSPDGKRSEFIDGKQV